MCPIILYIIIYIQSLFSQVNVSLNDKLITPSATTYPYRAMIETLLCAEAGPNQTKLPRHYIRRKFKAERHLDLSGGDLWRSNAKAMIDSLFITEGGN